MKEFTINGRNYRLPNALNPFQQEMYIHLINWKWQNITEEEGYYVHRGRKIPYDVILPESLRKDFPVIYPSVANALKQHHEKFYFKLHQHFNHMASSQAANSNLFLPVVLHPRANEVLRRLKSDFDDLATGELDKGFQIEFWGPRIGSGLLGDHTKLYGTDSDIAIAYYNKKRELCLWLIEHKLTEKEFTECNGYKSRGRKVNHDCSKSFSEIVERKNYCYYHDIRKFKYWEITDKNRGFFVNHAKHKQCPFQGGMNQLWRNQLLTLAIEQDTTQPYNRIYFSVVRHPENSYLNKTITEYKDLTADNAKFSVFTSADVINAAIDLHDSELDKWIAWYRELYNLQNTHWL